MATLKFRHRPSGTKARLIAQGEIKTIEGKQFSRYASNMNKGDAVHMARNLRSRTTWFVRIKKSLHGYDVYARQKPDRK